MPFYRKKPAQIEAKRFYGHEDYPETEIAEWCGGELRSASVGEGDDTIWVPVITIKTLEGVMAAFPGDWIIKGVQGEFYPCKPDIFDATYERVVGG